MGNTCCKRSDDSISLPRSPAHVGVSSDLCRKTSIPIPDDIHNITDFYNNKLYKVRDMYIFDHDNIIIKSKDEIPIDGIFKLYGFDYKKFKKFLSFRRKEVVDFIRYICSGYTDDLYVGYVGSDFHDRRNNQIILYYIDYQEVRQYSNSQTSSVSVKYIDHCINLNEHINEYIENMYKKINFGQRAGCLC